jgi:hypothetical protein
LFTAAQQIGAAPGRRRMQEQLASATPEERFDIAINQLTRAGELEKAANLEAQKAKYIADQQARTEDQLVNMVSAQMIASGATDVPENVTIAGREISVSPRLNAEILESVNTLQEARDARERAITSGELTPSYDQYLKDNPQLLEQNPMLAKAYENLANTESGMLRTTRQNVVKSLVTLVDNDRQARREARTGEKALGVRVKNLTDVIKQRGSKTFVWQGRDMADFLEDAEDDEIKLFEEQAVLKLQQDPNATEQEIIDYAMAGMREKIPGQKQSEAITAAEQEEAAIDQAIITTLMNVENLTREQALERLRSSKLEEAMNVVGAALATQGNISITGGN